MEQITASIANFILSAAGNGITPYYNELKQGFHVPSIFFPDIEVDGTPEDLDSYALTHSCYVKIFHSTTNDAYPQPIVVSNTYLFLLRGSIQTYRRSIHPV